MCQPTQRRISEKIKSTLDSDALPFHEILDADRGLRGVSLGGFARSALGGFAGSALVSGFSKEAGRRRSTDGRVQGATVTDRTVSWVTTLRTACPTRRVAEGERLRLAYGMRREQCLVNAAGAARRGNRRQARL